MTSRCINAVLETHHGSCTSVKMVEKWSSSTTCKGEVAAKAGSNNGQIMVKQWSKTAQIA
jgi:hypothetical protein